MINIGISKAKNNFAYDTIIYTIAFGIANVISFIYIIIVGRSLSASHFGVFNTLLGFISIAGYLGTSIQLSVIQTVTASPHASTFSRLLQQVVKIIIPGLVLTLIVTLPFVDHVGATSIQVAVGGLTIAIMFLATTVSGFLIGLGKIRLQVMLHTFTTILQLTIGYFFILFGLGVIGALFGYFFNYLAVFVISYFISLRFVVATPAAPEKEIRTTTFTFYSTAISVLTFVPFCIDQLLVQYYLPNFGGHYAAIATAVKPVFFAIYPIIAVTYPVLLRQVLYQAKFKLIIVALVATLCIALGIAAVINVFPDLLINTLFSTRFSEVTPEVGRLAFGIAFFAGSVLAAQALIAWRNPWGLVAPIIAILIQLVLYAHRHGSLADVVANQYWTYVVQAVVTISILLLTVRHAQHRKSLYI